MSLEELKSAVAAVQQKLTELESRSQPTPPIPDLELNRINKSLQKLTESATQAQILETYLQEAHLLAKRAVLFRRKKGRYDPWRALGFQPEQLPSVDVEDKEHPIVRAAENRNILVFNQNLGQVFSWLQTGEPTRTAACVPLIFEEAVPVVLYLDSPESLEVDSLELLTQLAILVLKNESLHRSVQNKSVDTQVSAEPSSPSADQTPSSAGGRFAPGIHRISEAAPLGPDLPKTDLVIEKDHSSGQKD